MAMNQVSAFHIDDGEVLMFPVDMAHAVGNHPYEWKKTPWTDREAAKARDAAKAKAEREARAAEGPKGRAAEAKPDEAKADENGNGENTAA